MRTEWAVRIPAEWYVARGLPHEQSDTIEVMDEPAARAMAVCDPTWTLLHRQVTEWATESSITRPAEQTRVRARSGDPSTSAAGGRSVARRAGSQSVRLLRVYATTVWYRDGVRLTAFTDSEAATAAIVPARSCWWKRCSELRQDGLIEVMRNSDGTEVTRPDSVSGEARIVCRITDDGRRLLRELGVTS